MCSSVRMIRASRWHPSTSSLPSSGGLSPREAWYSRFPGFTRRRHQVVSGRMAGPGSRRGMAQVHHCRMSESASTRSFADGGKRSWTWLARRGSNRRPSAAAKGASRRDRRGGRQGSPGRPTAQVIHRQGLDRRAGAAARRSSSGAGSGRKAASTSSSVRTAVKRLAKARVSVSRACRRTSWSASTGQWKKIGPTTWRMSDGSRFLSGWPMAVFSTKITRFRANRPERHRVRCRRWG